MRLIDADALQETLAIEPMENRTYVRANKIVVDAPTIRGEKGLKEMEQWQEQLLTECKGIMHEINMMNYAYQCDRTAPHVIHGAQVMRDGNQWCCVLGDLPTGVAGFGDTPEKACAEFDRVWREGK